uniref:N-sulfoglucosamine sulfohydrolase n=1 Tax=Plectus sambesii TaxID=2011161 RepID=A0A914WRB8_9BILA
MSAVVERRLAVSPLRGRRLRLYCGRRRACQLAPSLSEQQHIRVRLCRRLATGAKCESPLVLFVASPSALGRETTKIDMRLSALTTLQSPVLFVLVLVFAFIDAIAASKSALVIIVDDGGFESSVYGNTVVKTPALQSLANRGLTFDNAFTVVSSCSSSRASLLSGLPPHQNGMYGLHQDQHHFNCFEKVQSISRILRKHKIATGIIGKKHVGPEKVFPFDYAETEETRSTLQVGRNITFMKELVQEFLDQYQHKNFLLYIGFHDTHREHPSRGFGPFCEKFGNGEPGMGTIKDWTPQEFSPDQVIVPYFVPDTPAARADLAAQYTTISRMDAGVGLFLAEFQRRGLLNQTLVVFTSDNGIPFPSGRTNLYDPGMREPLIISNPREPSSFGKRTGALASTLDLVPTLLDWFNVTYPSYHLAKKRKVVLTGQSLLPLTESKPPKERVLFGSQTLHEISMYYPMRMARTHRFKLIRNLNHRSPFPIDQDFYLSPTFQDLLNRSQSHAATGWYKNIHDYYYRPQYELFDVISDPKETKNLAEDKGYAKVFQKLKFQLHNWMNATSDLWLCAPDFILEYTPTTAIKRLEETMKDTASKQEAQKEALMKMQGQLQQMQVRAAAK